MQLLGFGGVGAWRTPRLLKCLAQDELDLPVEAAQIVIRPPLDGVQQLAIHAEEEWFSVSHESWRLLVQGPGVQYGLGIAVRTQDDEQIGNHGRFAVIVQRDDTL